MRKLTVILITILLIILSGCSKATDNNSDFDIIYNNVTIWEDAAGSKNIILVFEVSNLSNDSIHFKKSDFNIVDENGNIIDTIRSVSAYPEIIDLGETAVYYGAKISNKIMKHFLF